MTPRVLSLRARPVSIPLRERFAIASGAQDAARIVLVRVELSDGVRGWGECAPLPPFNGETQAQALRALRAQKAWLLGRPLEGCEALGRALAERMDCSSALAGLQMALADVWARRRGLPLRLLFGGNGARLQTDVTLPLSEPARAAASARRWALRGFETLKIKVGADVELDAERVEAAGRAAPGLRLLLDANAGYTPAQALRLLGRLKSRGVRPALFEQPVAKADIEGLREVRQKGGVPVAADESAGSVADILALAKARAADAVNIKLMKSGLWAAWDMARAARRLGLKLMIGGMLESRLAMSCAAHLAAGLGGFDYVDLDTPLFLSRDPVLGLPLREGGLYDLAPARAGIGVVPRKAYAP